MKTQCPQCQKEYNFDDQKVPRPMVPIQCTGCKQVFYYHRGFGASKDKAPPTAAPSMAAKAPASPRVERTPVPQDDLEAMVRSLRAEKERLTREVSDSAGLRTDDIVLQEGGGSLESPPAQRKEAKPAVLPTSAKAAPAGPIEFSADDLGADLDTAVGKIQLETKEVKKSDVEGRLSSQAYAPPAREAADADTVKLRRPPVPPRFDIHTQARTIPRVKKFPWGTVLALTAAVVLGGGGLLLYWPYTGSEPELPQDPGRKGALNPTIQHPSPPPAINKAPAPLTSFPAPMPSAEAPAAPLSDLDMAKRLYRSHNPGSYRQAEQFYNNILAKNGEEASAWAGLSLVYSSQSQLTEDDALLQKAFALAQKAVLKADGNAEAHLALAQALVFGGKYEEGLKETMRVRELGGKENAQAQYLLALIARNGRNEKEKAAGYLRLAQKLDADDPRIHAELLSQLVKEKRKVEALLAAEKCRSQFSRSPACQMSAGRVFETFEKPVEAAQAYRQAAELMGDQLAPVLGEGRALLSQDEFGKAAETLRGTAGRRGSKRQKAEAEYLLGKALLGLKKEEVAFEAFERALLEDDTFVSPHNYLGEYYFKKENFDKAAEHLEKSLAARPDSILVRRNLAITYYKSAAYPRALEEFRKVIQDKVEKANPGNYYYLGLIYEKQGDRAKAVHMQRQALKLNPGYKNARQRLKKLGG